MVCQTATPGQIFSLPQPRDCNYPVPDEMAYPKIVSYELYRQNLIKYEVDGWLCRGVKQTAQLKTWFFGDENRGIFNSEEVLVITETCKEMVQTKMTKYG
jgi:hypothetical protein